MVISRTSSGRSTGAEALALPTDLGDDDRVGRLIEEVVGPYGRLDILVNSAMGLTQIDGTFWGAAWRLGGPERCRSTVRQLAKDRLLESERTGFILKEAEALLIVTA